MCNLGKILLSLFFYFSLNVYCAEKYQLNTTYSIDNYISDLKPSLSCGKKDPKKEKDCSKYGTDSDFVCCYIEKKSDGSKECKLASYDSAKAFGIKGKQHVYEGENEVAYIDCGNNAFGIKYTFKALMVLLLLFF